MLLSTTLSLALLLAVIAPQTSETPLVTASNPKAALKPETETDRQARHAGIAQVRANPAIILHRTAWQFAPENTISGIYAANELGAGGVEVDFHRTLDGVIVLFHDDDLTRLVDGFGRVDRYYYEELLLYTYNALPAPAAETERIPTLHDLLQTLRDRRMLAMIDLKSPGMDAEILGELRKADMLDHVAAFSPYNSTAFQEAKLALPAWKGSLADNDADLKAATDMLKLPGNLMIMDDPRAALTALGKPPARIVPKPWKPVDEMPQPDIPALEAVLRGDSKALPARLAAVRLAIHAPSRFAAMAAELAQSPDAEIRRAIAWNLGMIAKHRPALISDPQRAVLVRLLDDSDASVRGEAGAACGRAGIRDAVPILVKRLNDLPAQAGRWTDDQTVLAERQIAVENRTRYAFALGTLGDASPEGLHALLHVVKHCPLHSNRMIVGRDGVMAAWAIGKLRATNAVADLREIVQEKQTALASLKPPQKPSSLSERPTSTTITPDLAQFVRHVRILNTILTALGEIGSDDALAILDTIVNGSQPTTVQGGLRCTTAAEAILNAHGTGAPRRVLSLLNHPIPEVRRTAFFACLKNPDPQYRQFLESAIPWAVPWWDVQHGSSNRRQE